MTDDESYHAQYRLLSWLSPSYPVGAFTYSHGLETAVDDGLVHDLDTLVRWVETLLRHGGGWLDAVGFSATHRGDPLATVLERLRAQRGSAETALETEQQGDAFGRITTDTWAVPALVAAIEARGPLPYPVAVALACIELPGPSALHAYLHGFVSNQVSAGVRLVPLGQTDGQRAIATLRPTVDEVAATAWTTPLEDVALSAPLSELCSIRHETQYTRLFRS